MEGLWHLDETSWGQVTDSSGKARHATARNGAAPLAPGQVGVRCGTFDGVNDDISLPGIPLTSTFSVYAWFKSTAATRSAILSHATGDWVLEFNGNGVSTVPGAVTFSVGSGGTRRNCVAATGGLNDGRWHHVAGVREGDYIHVYVDGTAAGTMSLGGAVPNPSYDGALVAHHGIINTYFAGQVDEVAIFSTAVSEAWLRQSIAMGFDTEKVGAFTSEVFDAGGAAIWERISWQANASFGNPLTSTGGVVGLWHLDGITGGNLVVDASSSANNGTVVNATVSNDGRFGACLSFDGAGDYVSIPGAALPSASPFSVEAWVRPSDAGNRTIFDRRSGGSGYALLTDADGKLCFWVSSVTNRSVGGLRPGMWNHVAGVYDGKRIRSYINGDVVACSELVGGTLSAGNARLGSSEGGHSGDFLGLIDEVAVHTRGLTAEEVRDHARAGFGTLRFQVCVTNVAAPASPVFSGPDGTTNTYFTVAGETMVGKIPLGQYFQFRAELSTTDGLLEPRLQGFIVNQSRYPSDHPWVRPAVAKGAPFYGKLLTFSHAIATNVDSAVRYQVSGDNGTNWYWWSGSQWEPDGAGLGWLAANSVSLVNTNIGTFYSQLYQAKGGSFSFKAYLDSDGATQTAIDWAQLTKSRGRIVLLQPNGSERGEKAWVVGVPYAITWSSTGTVSGNIRIDLYNLSGSNFVRTIAANVPNTGSYTGVVGEDYGFDYRIRIRDLNDSTVEDWSDGDFELVQNLHLSVPNGGGKWYVGETNVVKWESPGWGGNNLGSPMELWFSADAGTNWQVIASVPNVVGNNSYAWLTPSNNASLVSEWAKMGVAVPGVPHPLTSFGDVSDGTFTNAGIAVTYPSIGAGVKMGNTITIRWTAAGAGATVSIDFFDGLSWSNITPDAACTPGTNTYDAPLNAPNPTTAARVRVSSNSDPKVWGVSDPFTLADVNIVVPVGGGAARAKWQMGTVKRVKWTAGGAGNSVDIHYTVDGVNWMVDGTNWVPIALNVTNVNSGGTVVTNESPDWVIPAPPTNMARVRVRSTTQTDLYAITEPFDIAGVHVAEPNGTINDNKDWEFVETNVVKWMHQAAGGQIAIEIAYEDNPATNEFESLYDSLSMFLTQRLISPSVVRRPSNYARIRVRAFSPPAETELLPMQDVSDSSFKIKGMSVVAPGSNAVYTMGTTVSQGLQWYSASAGSTSARFYYSTNASSFPTNTFYANQLNEDDGPAAGLNVRDFVVPRNQTPSTVSRIKIASGVYGAVSMPFTLRGIRINQPAAGQMVNIGAVNQAVVWASAGLQFSARAVGAVSTGGIGGPWQNGGMSTNISVLNAGVVWNVDPDLEPTTNAVMRLSVFSPTNDTDIVMYSDAFTLRGLRISAPAEGAVVDLGGSTAVTLKSAGMGAGARAAVYYAPDDVNFDFENPVTNEMSVVDGANSFTWVIESSPALTRMPSTNAHLMVVSGSFTNISRPFTVRGIKVTSPSRTDIWAVSDVTNVIKWKSVNAGPSYNLTFQLWSGGTVVYTEPIVSGYTGNEFVWTMTNSAVGSNVTIKVQDATYTGWSELFEIVPQPSIRILNPKAGDFWKVGTTNLIQWSRGGNVDNDFAVAYSVSPFDVTNYLRIGACDYTNGVFSLRWGPMPSTLGRTRIIVTNRVDALVADSFENFDIAARFDIQSFGSELYALETVGINWITRGNVASVDLFYSTDPLRASNSWVQINTNAPYAENVGNDLPVTPYAWLVPNIKTPEMWLRIQDHNYAGRQFVANKPGPFNDFGTFPVKYYTITWHVLDTATSNHLDGLSVSDSSGWSAANMASPVVHEYPNGVFDTVWFKEFFIDAVAFNWSSRPSRTNTVWMKRSDVEKGIQVLADFAFDAYTNRMTIHAWAQRAGLLLTDPSQCDVTVYSAAGQSLMTLSSTTPLSDSGKATGVFRIEWNNVTNVLAYGGTYFAKVTIVYSGQIYSSVVTYTLRLAMDMTAGQAVLDAIGTSQVNVQSNILEVASNLNALASAQSVFSSNAMERLNTLTGGVASIQTGVTNISQALGVLPGIASNVAVMLPLVTNIEARVAGIETTVSGTKSRILTRPETMIFGTTNTILYKSTAGFGSTVSLVVSNSLGGGPAAHVTTMGEVVAGLYQSDLVANWGSNSYVITCYDPPTTPQPGWDSIVVRVGAAPLTGNVALDQLLDDVSRIEQRITNVTEMLNGLTNTTDMLQVLDVSVGFLQDELTNILRTVTNMEVTVNTLTNLSTAAQVLTALDWGAISNVGGLASTMTNLQASVTNIQASLNSVTNLSGAMVAINGIQGSVSNLQISVGALTNLQSVVGVLTNVDWGAVSNIGGLSTSMTNMQATLALVQASVGGVSNYVVLLTNLPALASNVTNIQNSVADLQGAMAALTNLGDVAASLTNVDWGAISNMGSIGVTLSDIQTSVTNMEVSIGALANLGTVVASLTNVDWNAVSNVGGISASLTNIQGTVSGLQTTLGSVTNYMVTLTNLPAVASNVTNVQGAIANLQASMSALTNLGSVVSSLTNVNWNAVSNVGGISASLTNIQNTVSALQTSVGAVSNYVVALTNFPSLATSVTNMQGAIANIQASVNSLSNLGSVVSSLTNVNWGAVSNVGGLSVALTNIQSTLTNMPVLAGNVTNIQGQIGTIQTSLASLTNLGAAVSALTNVDWSAMAGVSALAGSVSNIQASVTNISLIQASVNDLADKMAGVDWDGLAGVPDSLNQFAPALQGLGTTAGSDISSIMRNVQDLARQAGQSGSSISDVQSGVRAIQQAMTALNGLQDRLGSGDAGQPSDSLFTRLSVLADSVGKIAGDASDASKSAQSAKTEAANASAGIQSIKDAMGRGDVTGVSAGLDKIREQLAAVRKAIDGISPAKETSSIEETVKKMAAEVEAFSKSTGVKWLTEMKEPPKVGVGEGTDGKRVEDLNAVLLEVRGRLEFLQKMIQDLRDKPVVEESLIGG
jgi:hypothetical protein